MTYFQRLLEILVVSTKLGLTSFGGPIAHLGYFREEYVNKRKWLTDKAYADLVALCQFLPVLGKQPGRDRDRCVSRGYTRRVHFIHWLHHAFCSCTHPIRFSR